jgi:hypothetical protein
MAFHEMNSPTSAESESGYTDATGASTNNGDIVRRKRIINIIPDEPGPDGDGLGFLVIVDLVESSRRDMDARRRGPSLVRSMSSTLYSERRPGDTEHTQLPVHEFQISSSVAQSKEDTHDLCNIARRRRLNHTRCRLRRRVRPMTQTNIVVA